MGGRPQAGQGDAQRWAPQALHLQWALGRGRGYVPGDPGSANGHTGVQEQEGWPGGGHEAQRPLRESVSPTRCALRAPTWTPGLGTLPWGSLPTSVVGCHSGLAGARGPQVLREGGSLGVGRTWAAEGQETP